MSIALIIFIVYAVGYVSLVALFTYSNAWESFFKDDKNDTLPFACAIWPVTLIIMGATMLAYMIGCVPPFIFITTQKVMKRIFKRR